MALPATDTFTGTDTDTLPTYSASWTAVRNNLVIDTNRAIGSAGDFCCCAWNADTFDDDQYSDSLMDIWSANSYMGASVRASLTAITYYGWNVGGGNDSYIHKYVAGTYTSLGSDSLSGPNTGSHNARLEAIGTNIDPIFDGTTRPMGPFTDSSITSGYAGVSAYTDTGQTGAITSWEGGNTTVSAGIQPLRRREMMRRAA